jgi:sugar phosphate isomerase/epimerase
MTNEGKEKIVRRPLGLHHLTVTELDALAFIEVAALAGYDQVTLFTNAPYVPQAGRESMFVYPTVTPQVAGEVRAALQANRLGMVGAEFFLMTADVNLQAYVPGLAVGAELGAAYAVTHVFDTDAARAVDTLGAFCDLAATEGLAVGIEFCTLTPGCRSIQQAAWFVDQVGRPNLGFGICPMHLTRSGGTAADIAKLDAHYFRYGQINDGHGLHSSSDYFAEVHDRELPGDGDFPLHDILSALPAGIPLEVKIPYDRRKETGVSALDFARQAFARSRPLVDGLEPSR